MGERRAGRFAVDRAITSMPEMACIIFVAERSAEKKRRRSIIGICEWRRAKCDAGRGYT
jgi:hypothetical protein